MGDDPKAEINITQFKFVCPLIIYPGEAGLYLHRGCEGFGVRAFWYDRVDAWCSEATMSRDCSTGGGSGSCCSV